MMGGCNIQRKMKDPESVNETDKEERDNCNTDANGSEKEMRIREGAQEGRH
jgi:hypothetical protein